MIIIFENNASYTYAWLREFLYNVIVLVYNGIVDDLLFPPDGNTVRIKPALRTGSYCKWSL